MKKLLFILLLFACFSSCKSSKSSSRREHVVIKKQKAEVKTNHSKKTKGNTLYKAEDIVNYAKKFEGVRYRYGGTTRKGMDCSGLINTAFKSEGISLPRTTKDLAITGDWIDLKQVKKGDLLFFATRKNSRKVNHIGIVTYSQVGRVEFIHASTSKGVIISDLSERYWYFAFVQARRVL
ncbi:NlpC/P60 family protein [Oceanihabitans sp. IOP_32]|uniref:C40 family peptidase n=1 Tax=Oceanihabitans sp. IOP_32 TaxID=2529032 RepID=UPI001293B952|nr:C40 family peptidase [Oceanihabitans sp. IOP_32]QFZ53963.1 NlpC/P60 family protein [Oceanihabitans sp. IOP_32]